MFSILFQLFLIILCFLNNSVLFSNRFSKFFHSEVSEKIVIGEVVVFITRNTVLVGLCDNFYLEGILTRALAIGSVVR